MFTANKAKTITSSAIKNKLNCQRIKTLQHIKEAASVGNNYIILDDPYVYLFEADYIFLEELGYKVTRPEKKYFKEAYCDKAPLLLNTSYGRVEW